MAEPIIHHLNHLRSKPESTRRRITASLTVGLTMLVAVVWVINLSFTFGSSNQPIAMVEPAPSPFSQVASVAVTNASTIADGFVTVVGGLLSWIK